MSHHKLTFGFTSGNVKTFIIQSEENLNRYIDAFERCRDVREIPPCNIIDGDDNDFLIVIDWNYVEWFTAEIIEEVKDAIDQVEE